MPCWRWLIDRFSALIWVRYYITDQVRTGAIQMDFCARWIFNTTCWRAVRG